MMNRYLILILYMSSYWNNFLWCQSNLRIGQWTTHLPYNAGNLVTESNEFVYYATNYSILKINKSDLSYERISRTEGLSGTQINALFFHQPSNQLIIAYQNGVLDLMSGGSVQTLVDIQNYSNIPIDKHINRIVALDDDHVFICGNFGLSQLNVKQSKFIFTLFTPNLKVYDCTKAGSFLYMAVENGLYQFDTQSFDIIQSFGSWKGLGLPEGIPQSATFLRVASFDDDIYATSSNAIYKARPGQVFTSFYSDSKYEIKYIRAGNLHLLAGLKCKGGCSGKLLGFDVNGGIHMAADGCADQNLDALESSDGRVWMADVRWSFRTSETLGAGCNEIWVNGPLSNRGWEIAPLSDGIYVATGAVDETFTPIYNSEGIALYRQGSWSMINSFTEPDLTSYNVTDVVRVLELPDRSKIYFASSGKGLIQYDRATDHYTVLNKSNSPLKGTVGDTGNIRLSGLALDRNGTLWMTNYLASVGLVSLDKSGQWKNYTFTNNPNLFVEVKVDQNGYKWIISRLSGGVMVFDEGDPSNPADDRQIQLTSANTEMTTNDVKTVEVDLDGDVWVGTSQGPVVFECGSSIFNGNCKGSRRKVDQNGIIYYLLASEAITAIAVDGANRKWFGTSNNGIYVQSPSGEFEIFHFNTSNSPLLDNTIQDIAIDPKTGEVWISSNGGIQVYRSDATSAKDQFTETPLVFPNPVPPDYDGIISIKGLARDARFKITDLSGRLVYEDFALGGQASWNGRDYLGRRVATGVYLLFANSTQDFETSTGITTKIVFTR